MQVDEINQMFAKARQRLELPPKQLVLLSLQDTAGQQHTRLTTGVEKQGSGQPHVLAKGASMRGSCLNRHLG